VAAERLFGLTVDDVSHLRKALEEGLGVASAAGIRVVEV